jgi:2-polyprenyl-3-methyl-5-hydroxy-6-metoxy-1,4-benzoquinol methylase/uncharacterized protein YbaR (Trm112 family)
MWPAQANLLACPRCRSRLSLRETVPDASGRVESGVLACGTCRERYPIVGYVPRFVPAHNYASGFGFQWKSHARTQLDSVTGLPISEQRFYDTTRWPRSLAGKTILEVGSGAGRFTEIMVRTGATVVSIDYSAAVEANFANNGQRENLLIAQADVYHLPTPKRSFDFVACLGVIQHTPDPAAAFRHLVDQLTPGGRIALDVYRKRSGLARLTMTHRWVRPLTRRMAPERLYRLTSAYVRTMWPLTKVLRRIPRIGRKLNWMLGVGDYGGKLDLPDAMLREWAVLDSFDMLSPAYEFPQTLAAVEQWLERAGLQEREVMPGHNGIEARGRA